MKILSLLALFTALLGACGDDTTGDDDDDDDLVDAGVEAAADAQSRRCLDDETLAALNDHAEALRVSAAMLAGHPGALEAIGFFQFVGLEVQRVAVYAGPLVMKCSEPNTYDEYCEDDGLCSQIECTGVGTSWEMHFRLDAPAAGDISYDEATIDTAWSEGDDGITFTTASAATGPEDLDWSVSATGRMDTDSFELEESYARLVPDGSTSLIIADTSEGVHGGMITIGGEVVATVDTDGIYVPSARCL